MYIRCIYDVISLLKSYYACHHLINNHFDVGRNISAQSVEVVVDITLWDKVCQWLATGRWFSLDTSVSFTNKTVRHDITEILLKVTLNTITLNPFCSVVYITRVKIVCRQNIVLFIFRHNLLFYVHYVQRSGWMLCLWRLR